MRLAEWLKYVEEMEKTQGESASTLEESPKSQESSESQRDAAPQTPQAEASVSSEPLGPHPEPPASPPASGTDPAGVAPSSFELEEPPSQVATAAQAETGPARPAAQLGQLDLRIPEIEDFLPFLREPQPEISAASPEDVQSTPLVEEPEASAEAVPAAAQNQPVSQPERPRPVPSQPAAVPVRTPRAAVRRAPPPSEKQTGESSAQAELGSLPKHIQSLARMTEEEIAQHSYKRSFREERGELLQRLLDPPLSLEDAARILNVCPTTVRRYTNRGALPHFRTVGNQRRFRLSDIIAFMESQGGRGGRGRKSRAESETGDESPG